MRHRPPWYDLSCWSGVKTQWFNRRCAIKHHISIYLLWQIKSSYFKGYRYFRDILQIFYNMLWCFHYRSHFHLQRQLSFYDITVLSSELTVARSLLLLQIHLWPIKVLCTKISLLSWVQDNGSFEKCNGTFVADNASLSRDIGTFVAVGPFFFQRDDGSFSTNFGTFVSFNEVLLFLVILILPLQITFFSYRYTDTIHLWRCVCDDRSRFCLQRYRYFRDFKTTVHLKHMVLS